MLLTYLVDCSIPMVNIIVIMTDIPRSLRSDLRTDVKAILESNSASISTVIIHNSTPVEYDGCKESVSGERAYLVLRMDEAVAECETLEQFVTAIRKFDIPFERLCSLHPGKMATAVTWLVGLPRPIQNHPLFGFLEDSHSIDLKEVAPKLEGRNLRWCELSREENMGALVYRLTERRFCLDSFLVA